MIPLHWAPRTIGRARSSGSFGKPKGWVQSSPWGAPCSKGQEPQQRKSSFPGASQPEFHSMPLVPAWWGKPVPLGWDGSSDTLDPFFLVREKAHYKHKKSKEGHESTTPRAVSGLEWAKFVLLRKYVSNWKHHHIWTKAGNRQRGWLFWVVVPVVWKWEFCGCQKV